MTAIYLGTQGRCELLNKALEKLAGQPLTPDRPGKEGFQLVSGRAGDACIAVVNGCDDLGTFHGVGWLLRRMRFHQAEATLPEGLRFSTAPASEMRRIRFGDHFGYVNTEVPRVAGDLVRLHPLGTVCRHLPLRSRASRRPASD